MSHSEKQQRRVYFQLCAWKLRPNHLSVIMCLLKSKWVVEKAKRKMNKLKSKYLCSVSSVTSHPHNVLQ